MCSGQISKFNQSYSLPNFVADISSTVASPCDQRRRICEKDLVEITWELAYFDLHHDQQDLHCLRAIWVLPFFFQFCRMRGAFRGVIARILRRLWSSSIRGVSWILGRIVRLSLRSRLRGRIRWRVLRRVLWRWLWLRLWLRFWPLHLIVSNSLCEDVSFF